MGTGRDRDLGRVVQKGLGDRRSGVGADWGEPGDDGRAQLDPMNPIKSPDRQGPVSWGRHVAPRIRIGAERVIPSRPGYSRRMLSAESARA